MTRRMQAFDLADIVPDPADAGLRADIRRFLAEHLADFASETARQIGYDAGFSKEMGRRGWIGSGWPRRYGGQDAGDRARFVILEEMLAKGAPVFAHMVGERQSGPLLLRHGTEEQRLRFLPRICAGEAFFCIGMSEPQAGSDLAALRLKAEIHPGGFRLNGSKIWTSLAHLADYIIVLCRTGAPSGGRHDGMSQLIVDLRAPGVLITPIVNLAGIHEFNQVFFDDVFVPNEDVIGTVGGGWAQAMGELTNERGGPDRYLSTFPLLCQSVERFGTDPDARCAEAVGRLAAHLCALRRLGQSVAQGLAAGEDPSLQAALVKQMGAAFEQDVTETLRHLLPPGEQGRDTLIAEAVLRNPSYSIRGGTREIMSGVIAKAMVGAP